MKCGIVYFKDTDNIGDDIQNYAVMQFMPQISYLIDREDLADFQSKKNEPVAVVLNGWYMHNKFNWPPSKDIYPLCLSMHFSPNDYLDVKYKFLDEIGGEYLKNYEPIGCRDSSTLKVLQEKGIDCYLSGCVTLTLPRREKKVTSKEYVCIVDVPEEVEKKTIEYLADSTIELRKVTHWVDYKNEPLSWETRMERVEEVLDIYQNAKCVVTKRLHCALPCLAMGTPVLLILDQDKDDVTRYSFFTELLHVMSTSEYISGKENYDIKSPIPNKDAYIAKRKFITNKIIDFVSEVTKEKACPQYEAWLSKEDKLIETWRMELLKEIAKYASTRIDEILCEKNDIAARTYKEISQINEQYEKDTDTLKREINSKLKEIKRLDTVIVEKNNEEYRLNNVITEKNREEHRLNDVIIEKNREEQRLNGIIAEKNQEQQRLNQIITTYKPNYDYVEQLEKNSVLWLVFFSKKFKNCSFREKVENIYSVLINKKKFSGK